LAEKYKVSYNTLKYRSVREDWNKNRGKNHRKITAKSQQKTIEKISDKISDVKAKQFETATALMSIIIKQINNNDQYNRHIVKLKTGYGLGEFDEKLITKELDVVNADLLLKITQAFAKTLDTQDKAMEYIDATSKAKLDIEKQKLDIEKQKLTIMQAKSGQEEPTIEDDGFLDALKGKAKEVWADDSEED